METAMLSLYHFDSCPFCELVRRTVSRLGVAVELRDIQTDPAHYQALIEATGRATVPCLRIERDSGDSSWMHESADIVQFLEELAA
jgi:glutaredoxin 2